MSYKHTHNLERNIHPIEKDYDDFIDAIDAVDSVNSTDIHEETYYDDMPELVEAADCIINISNIAPYPFTANTIPGIFRRLIMELFIHNYLILL